MSAPLSRWIEATQRRRGEAVGGSFAPGLLPDRCLDPGGALQAAATAIVTLVGGRRVAISFEPGASYVNLEETHVNLDGSVLEGDPPTLRSAELLVAYAAHEGGHVLTTEMPPEISDSLFLWLHNVIEDERVECEVVRCFPPLGHPLEVLRSDLIRRASWKAGALETLFALVRVPERLSRLHWRAHKGLLSDAMRILEPFPSTPEEVREAVRRIIECLPDSIREQPLPRKLDLRARLKQKRGFRWRNVPGGVSPHPEVVWKEASPDPVSYEEVRQEIASDAAALAARLASLLPPRPRSRLLHGQLDRRRFYAWRTDGHIFRGPDARPERLEVALIIDQSASMEGDSSKLAQRLAILLAEACAQVPGVRLHAYGHNADLDELRHTRITRYATPARGHAHTLGAIEFDGNNRDAHAIELIGRDLLTLGGARRNPRLALLLSDARPNADGFKGGEAVAATRRAIGWLEQVWGPTVLVATEDSPVMHSLVPGPVIPFDLERPAQGLARLVELCLRQH